MRIGTNISEERPGQATERLTVWPSSDQLDLLKAALWTGPPAAEAWTRWRTGNDPDSTDPSSGQLLALVYANLPAPELKNPDRDVLKRRYLGTWAANQVVFRMLHETLRLFREAGIPTLLLKGAALVPQFYRDEGVRGMGDFDVLVPEDRFREGCRVLEGQGWRPLDFDPGFFDTRFAHAIGFLDEAGNSADLHCHALVQSCEWQADRMFWADAVAVRIRDEDSLTLNPTDHLLQVCAHGLTWVENPPIRWAADALTILKVANRDLDWTRLVHIAEQRGVAYELSASLGFLQASLNAAIPAGITESLRHIASTRTGIVAAGSRMEDRRSRPLRLLQVHWHAYNRGIGEVSGLRRLFLLHQYVRFWAETDRAWKAPFVLFTKALRVAGRRMARPKT